ncbi:MAG: DUF389 domain-containing protein [Clostridia bacterium]|nr:DUF389 domain-containing protein [Clostridia bacterium]
MKKQENKVRIKNFFKDVFSMNENKLTKAEIKENIISGAKLKGTNMWILMLAIIIACVGLNMGSIEIVIGAMLISPMMGAIIGIGYSLATGDIKFLKRASFALFIEILICMVTSIAYFFLSPIKAVSATLLARTEPTIWDVIISITGGLAGAIGITRKEKGNILPGVAIATGLIPPLCTVGYGISVWNIKYITGALYMFIINALYISVSAMIVFKIIRMPKRRGETKKEESRIKRNVIIISIIAIIPSILFAYPFIKESQIESNVQKYINNEFNYQDTQIVKSNIDIKNKKIELALIGKVLDESEISNLTNKLKEYNLNDMTLRITQTEVEKGITKEEVSQIIELQEQKNVSKNDSNKDISVNSITDQITINIDKIKEDVKQKYSKVIECSITNNKVTNIDSNYTQSYIVNLTLNEPLTTEEKYEIQQYFNNLLGNEVIINEIL